jgi:hypothetical protein
MIALALIEFGAAKEPIQPALIEFLDVGCVLCRNVNPYAPHELVAWEAPLPTPTFRPHPAFR